MFYVLISNKKKKSFNLIVIIKDVLAERDYVRKVGKKFNGLAIHGITMEFSDFFGGSKFLAVDDLYLSVEAVKTEENMLFCSIIKFYFCFLTGKSGRVKDNFDF